MSLRAEWLIVAAVIALSASVTGADESPVRMSLWEVTETSIEHSRPDLAGDRPARTARASRYCQPDSGSSDFVSSLGMTDGLPGAAISVQRFTQQPGRRSLQSVSVTDRRFRVASPWHQFDSDRGWVSSHRTDAHGDFESEFFGEWSLRMQSLERSFPDGEPTRETGTAHAKRLGDCPPGTPPGRIKDPVEDGKVAPSTP
jgi:hypothetical protein